MCTNLFEVSAILLANITPLQKCREGCGGVDEEKEGGLGVTLTVSVRRRLKVTQSRELH